MMFEFICKFKLTYAFNTGLLTLQQKIYRYFRIAKQLSTDSPTKNLKCQS